MLFIFVKHFAHLFRNVLQQHHFSQISSLSNIKITLSIKLHEWNIWNSINIMMSHPYTQPTFSRLFVQIDSTLLIHMEILGHCSHKSNWLQPPVTLKGEKVYGKRINGSTDMIVRSMPHFSKRTESRVQWWGVFYILLWYGLRQNTMPLHASLEMRNIQMCPSRYHFCCTYCEMPDFTMSDLIMANRLPLPRKSWENARWNTSKCLIRKKETNYLDPPSTIKSRKHALSLMPKVKPCEESQCSSFVFFFIRK